MYYLSLIGNGCRLLGILSFIAMCITWYAVPNPALFILSKQLTVFFFCCSLLLWIVSVVIARRNK
jgi:hypothetical protein